MPDEAPWSTLKATLYSLVSRNPKSNRRIAAIVEPAANDVVLDIGCGPGAAVRAVAGLVDRASGVDASPTMVEIARKRSAAIPNVRFFVGAAEDLPFDDDSFTVVWTIQSWHHWNDSRRGIDEVARILRPAGRFYVIERKTSGAHGLSESSAERLAQQFTEAGFGSAQATRRGKDFVVSGMLPGLD